MTKFRFALLSLLSTCLASAPGQAGVWQHQKNDGTVEYTNVPRGGSSVRLPSTFAAATPPSANSGSAARGSGAFWFRERSDGVMEFTNLHPVGSKWKVLFRTGPGKASSVRGTTDRIAASDRSAERFSRFDEHIRDQQMLYGIPPSLARAVIRSESDFDPRVVSSAGAMGLMQLMPGTARDMGVTDAFDPRQSIMGGCRYLQILARKFCRTPSSGRPGVLFHCSAEENIKVISAYHAGPGAVDKYGGMPPYQTTRDYVATVLARFDRNVSAERGRTGPAFDAPWEASP